MDDKVTEKKVETKENPESQEGTDVQEEPEVYKQMKEAGYVDRILKGMSPVEQSQAESIAKEVLGGFEKAMLIIAKGLETEEGADALNSRWEHAVFQATQDYAKAKQAKQATETSEESE